MTNILTYQLLNFSTMVVILSSSRIICPPILAECKPLTSTLFASNMLFVWDGCRQRENNWVHIYPSSAHIDARKAYLLTMSVVYRFTRTSLATFVEQIAMLYHQAKSLEHSSLPTLSCLCY